MALTWFPVGARRRGSRGWEGSLRPDHLVRRPRAPSRVSTESTRLGGLALRSRDDSGSGSCPRAAQEGVGPQGRAGRGGCAPEDPTRASRRPGCAPAPLGPETQVWPVTHRRHPPLPAAPDWLPDAGQSQLTVRVCMSQPVCARRAGVSASRPEAAGVTGGRAEQGAAARSARARGARAGDTAGLASRRAP